MKSVVSAAWLFTTALGNLLVVIITENVTFESQVGHAFLLDFFLQIDLRIVRITLSDDTISRRPHRNKHWFAFKKVGSG
jgi:dipeptide/tripeptide permease